MDSIQIDTNVQIPMPVAVVGTMRMGKPNFSTIGWITRVNTTPPMLGFAVRKNGNTAKAVSMLKEFSISFTGRDLHKKVDYAGMVSSDHKDKSNLFESFYGMLNNAPLIKEAGVTLECKLVDMKEYPSNTFITGEIVNAWCRQDCMTDGVPDYVKMKAFTLTMPDNNYWNIGKKVGDAWSVKEL